MAKNEEAKVNEMSNEELINSLNVQMKDYKEKSEYYKVMAIKAEGAIDVLSQLEKGKQNG